MALNICPECGKRSPLREIDETKKRVDSRACVECRERLTDLESYRQALADVAAVDVRGDGEARFLYANSGVGAVEISSSGGGVWVEYWLGSADESVADETLFDCRVVLERVRRWLSVGST